MRKYIEYINFLLEHWKNKTIGSTISIPQSDFCPLVICLFSNFFPKNPYLEESKSHWCIRSEFILIKIGVLMNMWNSRWPPATVAIQPDIARGYIVFPSQVFYMIPTPFMSVSFTHKQYDFVEKGKAHLIRTTWNPRWMRRKLHNYVHIYNCLFYVVRMISYKTYNDIASSWHLSMTHNYWFAEVLDNAMSLILLLTISLLNLKRVVTMASIANLAWAKHAASQAAVLTARLIW